MELTKEFVNSCRKVGVLRDFLCQAIDQVDEKDKEIAELKEKHPFGLWREVPFEYWVQAWICVEKICRKKAKEYK